MRMSYGRDTSDQLFSGLWRRRDASDEENTIVALESERDQHAALTILSKLANMARLASSSPADPGIRA